MLGFLASPPLPAAWEEPRRARASLARFSGSLRKNAPRLAAMKRLCHGALGVVAVTLLIASIALLVTRVFQKVVDWEVQEVRRGPPEGFRGCRWLGGGDGD